MDTTKIVAHYKFVLKIKTIFVIAILHLQLFTDTFYILQFLYYNILCTYKILLLLFLLYEKALWQSVSKFYFFSHKTTLNDLKSFINLDLVNTNILKTLFIFTKFEVFACLQSSLKEQIDIQFRNLAFYLQLKVC